MQVTLTNKNLFKPLYWPVTQETCAFLVGTKDNEGFIINDVWPTPNITTRPLDTAYAIGRSAWIEAKNRARDVNLAVIGHVHTHVNEFPQPSDLDIQYIRSRELGGVLHIESNTLTFYTKKGCLKTIVLPPPNILIRLAMYLL